MKRKILNLFFVTVVFSSCLQQKRSNTYENLITDNSLINSIDHIPIVVSDLEKVKEIFKNQLHFTIKEGKAHEGIKNCFVKFQDGTYLEFINPIDSLQTIGKYYADFLATRQGGTSLAISISNAALVKKMLVEKSILFTADSNKIWQTIELKNSELFFIEYANKNWKENPTNTTHTNTATSLAATYILTNDIEADTKKYRTLGFREIENDDYLKTTYKVFKIGQSTLHIIDQAKTSKINKLFQSGKIQGICGFQIKVNSLQAFNNHIKQDKNVIYERNSTTIYLRDYNLFLTFKD